MELLEKKFKYVIDSGIDYHEIQDYFREICLENNELYKYIGNGWSVLIECLAPRVHGKITIPLTRIVFTGNETVCMRIIEDYRKKFMRGGG